MILQTKPNRWSCLPTAFSMVLGLPVTDFIKSIGHDGSEMWSFELCDEFCDPAGRRGFHTQECIRVAYRAGWTVTPIEVHPTSIGPTGHPICIYVEPDFSFFNNLIASQIGVITGRGRKTWHAVAFDQGMIFDPDGESYYYSQTNCELRGFITHCAWIFSRNYGP